MLAEAALLAVLAVERGPGAEACLDDARLQRAVERRLKRRVFVTEAEASLRVRVAFTAHDGELEARIELSSVDGTPRGTRALVTTAHCSALDDSLALSIALLVDEPPDPIPPSEANPPTASAAETQPATSTTPLASKPPTAPVSPVRVITIPADVAAPREPWHLALGAAGKAEWGRLPGVRPAGVLSLRLMLHGFAPILVQGEGFAPARAARNESSGADFHLYRAGLAVCPALAEGARGTWSICAGQELGWLTVQGYGFDHDAKQQRLGYALTLGGEGRFRLFPPVSVRGYLGGEVPLVRDRFTSAGRNAAELFQPSILNLAAEIGLEAALW